MLGIWWIWIVGGMAVLAVTALLPEAILLGFAFGAMITGILLAIGVPLANSAPLILVVFATVSLLAWLVLRRVLGIRRGQVKNWTRDINEN